MKKLFILVSVLIVLFTGVLVYKNIDNILPTNPPSIEQPGDNIQDNEKPGDNVVEGEKPVVNGIELDKQYIFF